VNQPLGGAGAAPCSLDFSMMTCGVTRGAGVTGGGVTGRGVMGRGVASGFGRGVGSGSGGGFGFGVIAGSGGLGVGGCGVGSGCGVMSGRIGFGFGLGVCCAGVASGMVRISSRALRNCRFFSASLTCCPWSAVLNSIPRPMNKLTWKRTRRIVGRKLKAQSSKLKKSSSWTIGIGGKATRGFFTLALRILGTSLEL
jgi:hypothetical protein